MNKIVSNSENETFLIGKTFASLLPDVMTICLVGDLGAGKTHFVKGMCEYFGVLEQFSSPTYTIVNKYENDEKSIYHMDAYRLMGIDELDYIDFYEYYNKEILIIEWADIIKEELNENIIWIDIEKDSQDFNKRVLSFSSSDEVCDLIIKKLEEKYG